MSLLITTPYFAASGSVPAFGTGVLAGGYNGVDGRVSSSEIYSFSDDVVTNGSSLATATNLSTSECMGTSSDGLIGPGYGPSYNTNTVRYNFSGNLFTAGTSVGTPARYNPAGSSNSVKAYVAGGNTSGGSIATAILYTFAGDVVASTTALNLSDYQSTGMGNSTDSYVMGGTTNRRNVNKYNFASTSITNNISALAYTNGYPQATGAGNSTHGFICYLATEKYAYSTDTTVTSTTLPNSTTGSGTMGHSVGFVASGSTNDSAKFEYAGETTIVGTSLTVARGNPGALSDNHGGLL